MHAFDAFRMSATWLTFRHTLVTVQRENVGFAASLDYPVVVDTRRRFDAGRRNVAWFSVTGERRQLAHCLPETSGRCAATYGG